MKDVNKQIFFTTVNTVSGEAPAKVREIDLEVSFKSQAYKKTVLTHLLSFVCKHLDLIFRKLLGQTITNLIERCPTPILREAGT